MATLSQKIERLNIARSEVLADLRRSLESQSPDADAKTIGAQVKALLPGESVPASGDSVEFGPMFAKGSMFHGATGTVTPGGIVRHCVGGKRQVIVATASPVGRRGHFLVPAGLLVKVPTA